MQRLAVEDLSDPRVADYRNVRDADLRDDAGLFLAEGRLNVKRLIQGDRHATRSVFVTRAGFDALRDVLQGLPDRVPVYVAPQAVLNGVVGYDMHRGCLAAGERGLAPRFEEVLARAATAPRLWLVLEDVTNPDNVGGCFRNALAFGVEQVVLTPRCADPLYRKSIRVSMGATLRLPFCQAPDWPAEAKALREAGFQVVALVAERDAPSVSQLGLSPEAPVALLVGNEGEGLGATTLGAATACATIPTAPDVDSLNAATASGIALQQAAAALGIVRA